jgi:hypothetical protein
LEKRLGLFSKAKKIIVGGLSAGANAALQWANYIAERANNS